MELSQLRMIKSVAECGSIALAAQQLHCVPSNITTRIKHLENELGTVLFTRAGRGLKISSAGQLFLGYCERILALVEEAKRAVTPDANPNGILRIGAIDSCASGRLPPLLAEYHQRYPDVTLELVTGQWPQLLDDVQHHRLDAAIVAIDVQHPKLLATDLYHEPLILIAGASHAPLTELSAIAMQTVFMWPAGCPYRATLEQWLGGHNLRINSVAYANWGSIIGCVDAGAGLAIVPEGILERFGAGAALTRYRFNDLQPVQNRLVWHRETGCHSARDAFASLLAERFSQQNPAMNAACK